MATAALFCGMHFAPALFGPPIVARLEQLPARITLPALYAAEAAAFAVLALIVERLLAPRRARPCHLRRLDRVGGPGADPSFRSRRCSPRRGSCGRETRCSTSPSRSAPPAGPRSPDWWWPEQGWRPRSPATRSPSSPSRSSSVSRAASPPPRPRRSRAAGRRACGVDLAYVRERPALRRLLGAQAAAFVFFSLVIPIEVVFAKETLDAGDAGYGALLASWGVGMVAGSLVFAGLRRVALRALLLVLDAGDRRRLSRDRRRPDPAGRLRGIGDRRARQRRAVDRARDRRAGAHPGHLPGARAVAARGARERDARASASCSAARSPRSSAPRVGYAVAGAGVVVVLLLAAARAAPGRLGSPSSSRVVAGRCKFRCKRATPHARC